MRRSGAALVVWATLLSAACSSARTVEPRQLSLAIERACRQTAVALCGRTTECSPKLVSFFFGSFATCEADVFDECATRYEGPASGDVVVCDVAPVSCESLKHLVMLPPERPGATLMRQCATTPGRLPAGSVCFTHGDCTTGFCAHEKGATCGECLLPPREGEPCSTSAECPAPLRCVGEPARCSRVVNAGEPCGEGRSVCALGGCQDGRCSTPLGLAETCDPQRGIRACDLGLGLWCNERSLRCEPLTIAGLGAACSGTFCAGEGTMRATCKDGSCVPTIGDEQSLLFSSPPKPCAGPRDCAADAVCVNRHCRRSCTH